MIRPLTRERALSSVGLRADRRIVVAGARPLCRKAGQELKDFLSATYGLDLPVVDPSRADGSGRIIMGSLADVPLIRTLLPKKSLSLSRIAEGPDLHDAYILKQTGDDTLVLGSNDRSVLYAVFHLEDWIRGDRNGQRRLDVFEKAHFRDRWMNPTIHGRCDVRANYDYLARIGVNTAYLRARYDAYHHSSSALQGLRACSFDKKHLPILSRMQPPHKSISSMMAGAYRLAKAHGMDTVVFVDEPKVLSPEKPRDARIIEQLSPDMMGYPFHEGYRREGRLALSIFHPKVERHYRELVRNLLRQYPELGNLYVYNQDVGADNCWPPADPAGRRFYPKGYAKYPYAAHARIVEILQEEGRRHNPSFRVVTGTWHWFYDLGVIDQMMRRLPSGSVLACLNTNDDRVAVVRPRMEIRRILRHVRARGDLVLIADDDFNGTSDDLLTTMTAGFPVPFRTYRKMRRWALEGATGITQHHTGGPSLLVNSINDLAWRYFSWHPLVPKSTASRKIRDWMVAQLGDRRAAARMLEACRYIDKALDLDERTKRPYQARLTHGLVNTVAPLTQEGAPAIVRQAIANGVYDQSLWHASLAQEVRLLQKALKSAEAAARIAPTGKRPFFLPWKEGSLTCRAYACVQKETIEIVFRVKTSMLHFIRAARLASNRRSLARVIAAERTNTRRLIAAIRRHRRWDVDGYYGFLLKELRKKTVS